ncbi:MAG: 4Fe-4S dicluster domain-containing protein [Methanobacterium sp.]
MIKYQRDNCGYCGACVTVCSQQILELTENEVTKGTGCDECGNCTIICPLGAFTREDEPHDV